MKSDPLWKVPEGAVCSEDEGEASAGGEVRKEGEVGEQLHVFHPGSVETSKGRAALTLPARVTQLILIHR